VTPQRMLGDEPRNDVPRSVLSVNPSQQTPHPRTTRFYGSGQDDQRGWRPWLHSREVRRRSEQHGEYSEFLRYECDSDQWWIFGIRPVELVVIESRDTVVGVENENEWEWDIDL